MNEVEAVARAIEGVRIFARFNDWTNDHVPGYPIEICRWVGEFDEDCEIIARYPGRREGDSVAHLDRHVNQGRAQAAIAALDAARGDQVARVVEWLRNGGGTDISQLNGSMQMLFLKGMNRYADAIERGDPFND